MKLQMQDCTVNITPVSDESCADPYSNNYTYNSLAVQAYYHTTQTVRTLLPAQGSSFALNIDNYVPSNGAADDWKSQMRIFAATTNISLASAAAGQCTTVPTVSGMDPLFKSVDEEDRTQCPSGSYDGGIFFGCYYW